jgi:hypothetical protein
LLSGDPTYTTPFATAGDEEIAPPVAADQIASHLGSAPLHRGLCGSVPNAYNRPSIEPT